VIQQKDKISLINWEIVSVNPNDKTWTWKTLFCFWGNSFQTIIGFSLISSLFIVYNLNFFVVLIGLIIGSLFVYYFVNLIGKPSQKHGIPFPVFLRVSHGIIGAKYISLIRGIVGLFMFGIQTFFISVSLSYIMRLVIYSIDNSLLNEEFFLTSYYNMTIIDWFSFSLTIFLQFFLFSKGHLFNKNFINFSALFVYFGLSIFLVMIFSENYDDLVYEAKYLITVENIISIKSFNQILTVAGTIFAYFSIVILNFGDFSRYVKNERELKKGNLSLILNLIIFSLFSVLIVFGTDIVLNNNSTDIEQIYTNPTDIIGKFDNNYLTVFALIFIIFASLSSNLIANYIPSQNTLINFIPKKLSLKSSGFLIIFFGSLVGIFWMPLLSQIGVLSFIDTLGCFFGPIFGVILADYYFVKTKKIENKDVFSTLKTGSYYYSGGWHIKAIYSLIIGFIFSASTIWNPEIRFLQSFSWIIGFFISFIMYLLLAKK